MSVTIRPATLEDAPGIAEVHSASWRATYRGIAPQRHLDRMDPEKTVERWRRHAQGGMPDPRLLVADAGGRIVGFQAYGPAREPNFGYSGELYAAYFLPEAMGKGLGSAMVAHFAEGLARHGIDDMIVWVMEANARSCRFYEAVLGGAVIPGSRQRFKIDGEEIWEIAYGLRPLSVIAPRG